MIQKRFMLSGLHCPSCSMLIEGALMDLGVDAACDYGKSVVDVTFDETKVQESKIRATIEELGYKAIVNK